MRKNVLGERGYYKPFTHNKFYEYYLTHFSMMWTPEETKLDDDVYDWNNKLSKSEKHFLTNVFRFFTEADVDVAGAYSEVYLPLFKLPEVRMMLLDFAAREAVHVRAYSYLIDTIGMPSTTYKAFYDYEAMANKHDYFQSFKSPDGSVDIPTLLRQIAAFSAFTEGMQLFSSFIMLLNFKRFGKMKGMGELVQWSIRDEECLDANTLVHTNRGLVPISEINVDVDMVYQFDPVDRTCSLVIPSRKVTSTSDVVYEMVDEHGVVVQRVTPNHRVLFANMDKVDVLTAKELVGCSIILPPSSGELSIRSCRVTVIERVLDGTETFHCLTVPTGAFAIQREGVGSITGNCHFQGMAELFKTLVRENPVYNTDELRDDIYSIAHTMVDLENKFIDLCFEMGPMEGLTADEVKEYIKYICDRRLIGLGYKGIFKVKTNPLFWVEEMLNAPGHSNFFEARSTDYSRGVHTGSWSKFWTKPSTGGADEHPENA